MAFSGSAIYPIQGHEWKDFCHFFADLAARYVAGPVRERGGFASPLSWLLMAGLVRRHRGLASPFLAVYFMAGWVRRRGGFALPLAWPFVPWLVWSGGMVVLRHLRLGCPFHGWCG